MTVIKKVLKNTCVVQIFDFLADKLYVLNVTVVYSFDSRLLFMTNLTAKFEVGTSMRFPVIHRTNFTTNGWTNGDTIQQSQK